MNGLSLPSALLHSSETQVWSDHFSCFCTSCGFSQWNKGQKTWMGTDRDVREDALHCPSPLPLACSALALFSSHLNRITPLNYVPSCLQNALFREVFPDLIRLSKHLLWCYRTLSLNTFIHSVTVWLIYIQVNLFPKLSAPGRQKPRLILSVKPQHLTE